MHSNSKTFDSSEFLRKLRVFFPEWKIEQEHMKKKSLN